MHGRTSFAEGNHPERRSRNPSLRGGSAFAPDQPPIDETRPSPTPMRRNLSFMWDWAKFRDSPPATPHASLHGGQAFATAGEAEKTQLAVEPPKALTRDRSIGSFMWSWDAMRSSNTSSPNTSVHNGGTTRFIVHENERT